jgi:hypothetical protein
MYMYMAMCSITPKSERSMILAQKYNICPYYVPYKVFLRNRYPVFIMRAFENNVMKIFGPERKEVT